MVPARGRAALQRDRRRARAALRERFPDGAPGPAQPCRADRRARRRACAPVDPLRRTGALGRPGCGGAGTARARQPAGRDAHVVGAVGARGAVRRAVRGRHDPVGGGAESADVRADRCDRGGAYCVATGAHPRRCELGLPLQLGPRLDVHGARPLRAGIRERARGLPAVRRTKRGRHRYGHPGCVRDRRRASPDRDGARAPRGIPRLCAGSDRQRRVAPGAARRVRGSHGPRMAVVRARPFARRRLLGVHRRHGRLRVRALDRPRPRDLGGPRRAETLRALESDVLGGRRSRAQACRGVRAPRADGSLGTDA